MITTKLISSYSQVNFSIYDKADIIKLIEVINDELLIIEYIIKKAARIGPPWKLFSVSWCLEAVLAFDVDQTANRTIGGNVAIRARIVVLLHGQALVEYILSTDAEG